MKRRARNIRTAGGDLIALGWYEENGNLYMEVGDVEIDMSPSDARRFAAALSATADESERLAANKAVG